MLNEGLWIDTIFYPCESSLDYTFKIAKNRAYVLVKTS
jgi:hypothetical protein